VGNGQAVSAALFNRLPFDVLKDFIPISVVASFEMLLATPGNSPYRSLNAFVEAAKRNPGKLNIGAINPGSTQNLSAHLLRQATGADYAIITYRTTPDLVTALLRGDVDLGVDYYAGLSSELADGRLRIIATSGAERNPLLQDVPTAKDSGFPQYVVVGWNGVAAPAGVPADVVQFLSTEINRALAAPDLQEQARRLGLDARGSTPQEMRDRLATEIVRWREVIEKAGIPKL
jgi:tripartite-type tricarboxylate transporter receptor subunit TctC